MSPDRKLNLEEAHAAGVILPVRVQAGARRTALGGTHGGMLKISVTQAPEKGKANEAVLELVREQLGLRRGQVELLSGATSTSKRLLIRGVDAETIRARVEQILARLAK